MSLLLDALKKAADDKQKASQNGASQKQAPQKETSKAEVITAEPASSGLKAEAAASEKAKTLTEELTLQETNDTPDATAAPGEDTTVLSLDDIEPEHGSHLAASDLKTDRLNTSSVETEGLTLESNAANTSGQQNSIENGPEYSDSGAGRFTVSDEALSMLIHKTNRDVKRGRRILIFSVLIISLAITVSGGLFYYMDMQAEIAALERKHRVAMQAMRSKTSREKIPDNSEIIRNLVSESTLDKKVQYAKQHNASEKNPGQVQDKVNVKAENNSGNTKTATPALSIQKTNKPDPVGEKLDAAWLAYESGQYDEATKLYKETLSFEKNNRDALLGLGAIAILEKNKTQAKNIYLALLELDPRDPIATAALASLHNDLSTLDSDKAYLLSMLEKNPGANHLNFALGNIYAQQNKWKSAQQYYFNAWQYNNENADYLFNLAVSMDQLSKQEQAINFYKESLLKSVNKQVSFSREAVEKRISELSEL